MTKRNKGWGAKAAQGLLIGLFAAVFSHESFAATVTLAWDAVTTNADGTAITDLSGYRLFRSNSSLLGRTTAQAMADGNVTKTDVGNVLTTTVNLTGPATYFFRLTAFDTSGNQSGFNVDNNNLDVQVSTFIPAADNAAPVISAVQATNIGLSSVTIRWTTNEPSTSQVDYGLTTSYGSSTPLDNNLVTSHVVTITVLNPATLYNYRVRSRDAASNLATGANNTFTTAAGSSPMDVNRDGQVNVSDVQLAVNQALGVTGCGTADTNGDGLCNVNDVQRVVNAALGV